MLCINFRNPINSIQTILSYKEDTIFSTKNQDGLDINDILTAAYCTRSITCTRTLCRSTVSRRCVYACVLAECWCTDCGNHRTCTCKDVHRCVVLHDSWYCHGPPPCSHSMDICTAFLRCGAGHVSPGYQGFGICTHSTRRDRTWHRSHLWCTSLLVALWSSLWWTYHPQPLGWTILELKQTNYCTNIILLYFVCCDGVLCNI